MSYVLPIGGVIPAACLAGYGCNYVTSAGQGNESIFNSQQVDNTPPQIGGMRIALNYLTKDQIKEVNRTRRLPDNAKFVQTGFGKYEICNNFFDLRAGTQVLPEGYEVKRDLLGFTIVVPAGTKGLFIRNNK